MNHTPQRGDGQLLIEQGRHVKITRHQPDTGVEQNVRGNLKDLDLVLGVELKRLSGKKPEGLIILFHEEKLKLRRSGNKAFAEPEEN